MYSLGIYGSVGGVKSVNSQKIYASKHDEGKMQTPETKLGLHTCNLAVIDVPKMQ